MVPTLTLDSHVGQVVHFASKEASWKARWGLRRLTILSSSGEPMAANRQPSRLSLRLSRAGKFSHADSHSVSWRHSWRQAIKRKLGCYVSPMACWLNCSAALKPVLTTWVQSQQIEADSIAFHPSKIKKMNIQLTVGQSFFFLFMIMLSTAQRML